MPPKLSITDMRTAAAAHGGKCLSASYTNAQTKLHWECDKGHQWWAMPQSVRKGVWCPACAPNSKLGLADMQALAASRGGECLSEAYINVRTPLRWRCAMGHEWGARPVGLTEGRWCPTCGTMSAAEKSRLTIGDMQRTAAKRGGRCTSSDYLNVRQRLQWACAAGHEWDATGAAIRAGGWCPECSPTRQLTIEHAEAHAQARGGRLVTAAPYANAEVPLEWACAEGHTWSAPLRSIRRCPVCAHGTHTIEVPRRIASERGGLCLSEEYRNLREPLAWRCQAGHEWSAGLGNVMGHGTWCPYCPYRSEDECRRLFEELTGQRFPKSRPAWLGGLELDGANYGLSLAFEYQGEQHYAVVPHWHRRGAADLAEQQARDQRKRELCQSQGIALIEVPYWVKDRRAYIAEALASHRTTRTLQPEPARSGSATAVCALTDAELDELLDL